MSERAILTASPEAHAAAANRPARTMPTTVTPPPRPPLPLRDSRGRLNLTAKALKVTMTLDPAQLAEVTVPNGAGPQQLRITVGARRVSGQVSAKSLRRAAAMIAEHGVEKIAVLVQGRLEEGDIITGAGLVAQVKGSRPSPDLVAAEQNSPEKSVAA
jgi:hypothetical protein